MITTVTLNATIDKTCFLGSLEIGRVNRVPVMHTAPGGKGINAARVAHQLGCPVLATGFVAGFNGSYIESELSRTGILHDFVKVQGESRVSLNIIDQFSGLTTEILEQGPTVGDDEILSMKDKLRQLASESSIIAINGSLPLGAPANLYADFIEIARQEGALTVLDASGPALLAGIEAIPTCVKPNEHEIADILGRTPASDSEIADAVRHLMDKGIACVAVTLGSRGALAGMNGAIFRVRIPELHAVNAVGCGDSFVGGLCMGLYKKQGPEECIRLAAAAATADALTEEAGSIRLDDVKSLMGRIDLEPIR
ncbi:1-phosphofructokinase family hexose kinase [Gorillibacterium sp. sgz5001074]|uniref:1-phosphofructokinase family hexose kinase n=1 Tax=Gorillibacterium sp. sgz5001074 TaxID=3446695 RepID=UPI003F67E14F